MQSRPAKLACMLGAIFGAVVLVAVPREASTAAAPGRRLSAFNGALCYAARYPDVKAAFCDGDRCNARQAMAHFRDHGRREGIAADVGPRLAERVAEAVREATTL